MPSRPERRRRRMTLLALASLSAAGMFAFACGIDVVASKDFPTPLADATPIPEANLPPMNDGSSPDAPPPDAMVDAAEAGCPTGHGDMVEVRDAGGLSFCIDSTEVTNAEYDKFVTATDGGAITEFDAGSVSGCDGNSTYAPTPVVGSADFPVVNINWCDAHAYCLWAGKRLCGHTDSLDASTGEWFAACSNGGAQTYPYPGAYQTGACNDDNVGVASVSSFPGCEGGVPGLFDMTGNVSEFIDNCGAVNCTLAGGDYSSPSACTSASDYPKATTSARFVGFRCCSDAP